MFHHTFPAYQPFAFTKVPIDVSLSFATRASFLCDLCFLHLLCWLHHIISEKQKKTGNRNGKIIINEIGKNEKEQRCQ